MARGRYPILQWSPYADSVKYNIYRGTTKENLEKIGETTLLQFQDSSASADIIKKLDRVTYYYQVRSVDGNGDEVIISDTSTIQQPIDYPYQGILNVIVKRNDIMLGMTGEEVMFYLRKGAGSRCPKCFNEITRDSDQQTDLCDVCYNTTFEGGFESVRGLCRIRNAPEYEVETIMGLRMEAKGRTGWISDYPIVSNGDFIKTKGGEIYEIVNPTKRNIKDFVTIQLFELKTLETSHPYYRIAEV